MTATEVALVEGKRAAAAAEDAGIPLRLTGGVAVATRCPSALEPPLRREYRDIDFVGLRRDAHDIRGLFASLGYAPEEEFNLFHGKHRLFFHHREHGYEADVFLDRIEMCHTLDLRDRLDQTPMTLSLADLLLSKLQVVQTNDKDFKDILALLADHEPQYGAGIDLDRIDELCGKDWGWWKTVTLVIERAVDHARQILNTNGVDGERLHLAVDRLSELREYLELVPKSRRWKLRAQVGERVRWHEEPEDIEHDSPEVAGR